VSRSVRSREEDVTLEALAAELRRVVTAGLGRRLNEDELPILKMVVARLGNQDPPDFAAQVEQVVKPLVQQLGDSKPGEAAPLLFGADKTSAGLRKVGDRRRLAADIYGIEPDTFSRKEELRICAIIAKKLLDCYRAAAPEADLASGRSANGHDRPAPTTPGNRAHETIAALDEPTALALDPVERRLFVVERGKHRVVQVDLADGRITPVAGVGERGFSGDGTDARLARLNRPDGIALDVDRQLLYIADTDNHRVRRMHLPTGQITTIAGTGRFWPGGRVRSYLPTRPDGPAIKAKLAFPRGLALSRDGTQVFIAAPGSSSIRVLHPAKDFMRVLAGNGKLADTGDGRWPKRISLAVPVRLAFDAERQLIYVSQDASPAVRYFGLSYSQGEMQTVPGTDTGTRPTNQQQVFADDRGHGGIALDQSTNRLYVNASPGIACVQLPDGARSMVPVTDDLRHIGDLLFDSEGRCLYVSLSSEHRVVRIALP
jgi:DNA-binding beta-propeller fold protein YncE